MNIDVVHCCSCEEHGLNQATVFFGCVQHPCLIDSMKCESGRQPHRSVMECTGV